MQSIVIVIPTCGRQDLLLRTVRSLGDCEPPAAPVRSIIAENGPQCGAENVVRDAAKWLHAEYQHSQTPNKSASLNRALEGAGDALMVFFDDDVRIAPKTIVAYERTAQEYPQATFFGGPMGVDYEEEPPGWIKPSLPPSAVGVSLDEAMETEPCPFMGCNWAAYANDLRRCGGFNPDIGPGATTGATGQESEMQVRLSRAGIRRKVVPHAMVWHYVPRERCSPEWALQRAYKHGLAAGMIQPHDGARLWGYPRWLVREWIQRTAKAYLTPFRGDRAKRFAARRRLAFLRGRMCGARAAYLEKRMKHQSDAGRDYKQTMNVQ